MRQGDGADLPGANNPPDAETGIIYVSPDDARQSVLEAILMQDKLGRQYIVLVLPVKTHNKALSRPADFDGLKGMRGDLYGQLVIIAPPGSTPAELARQRRFSVYPDLETFARSLRDDEASPESASDQTHVQSQGGKHEPGVAFAPYSTSSLPAQPTENSDEQRGDQADTDDDGERVQVFPIATPSEESHENVPGASPAEPAAPHPAENMEEHIILIPPQSSASPPANYPVPAGVAAPARSGIVVPAGYAPRHRRWWIALLIVLLVLLVGLLGYQPLLNLIFVPKATVTITPASREVQQTYTITAVVGKLDATQAQVQARVLFAASETLQKTVNTSGVAHIPATQAVGLLTFYNPSPVERTVPAGTVFFGASGIAVVNDASVTIPASVLPTTGQIMAPAHAVDAGASGNIPAGDLNAVTCCGTPAVLVSNVAPFAGGADAQTFRYVEQSDIDATAAALAISLTSKTQAGIVKQVQPGEHLVAPPHCVPFVTSNQAAGDKAETVTVSESITCTGEVFDQSGAYRLADNLLTTGLASPPGAAYAPVGHIVTTIQQATVGTQDTITLRVQAEGVWVYQFKTTQLSALRTLVVGKNQQDAQALLLKQNGVRQTTIQLSGWTGSTLPSDPKQIEFYVVNVPGL